MQDTCELVPSISVGQLLKERDRSIMDIALLCGFNSHSHLSKQFRQLTGITPKQYRINQFS